MYSIFDILKKASDDYNEDRTEMDNILRIINAICLAQIVAESEKVGKIDILILNRLNSKFRQYLLARAYKKDFTNEFNVLSDVIGKNINIVYIVMGALLKYKKSDIWDQEMADPTYYDGTIMTEVKDV